MLTMKAIAKAGIHPDSFEYDCADMSLTRGVQYRT
jgi:hypothetical protein